jgi:hypothetical protein
MTDSNEHSAQPKKTAESTTSKLRNLWSIIAVSLVTVIFMEAALAGAILSGIDGALKAHMVVAGIMVASTILAGSVSVITLRRVQGGGSFSFILVVLAALTTFQMAIGKLSAHGANLLWAHVPLGVALFGLAALAVVRARRLGMMN